MAEYLIDKESLDLKEYIEPTIPTPKSGSITGGYAPSGITREYGDVNQFGNIVTVNAKYSFSQNVPNSSVNLGTLTGVSMPKRAMTVPCLVRNPQYQETYENWRGWAAKISTSGVITMETPDAEDYEVVLSFSYGA